MQFLPFTLFLLFCSLCSPVFSVQQPFIGPDLPVKKNILTQEIGQFIQDILASWNSAGGVGIAVVQKNEDGSWNVETKGYGTARADGSGVTEDTLFAIGSNSKLFDVFATGLLISNESISPRISWNTKISSLIPEWELADPIATSKSTIIDLMSHRTGLPRHDISYNEEQSVPEVISNIKHLRPSAEFREVWQYNNIMYTVLSYLPEVVLHIPFTHFVKNNIFLPLGLHSTTYSGDVAEKSGNLASGFARDKVNRTKDIFGRGIPRSIPFWSPKGEKMGIVRCFACYHFVYLFFAAVVSGAGGVISSARDMATWLQALLLQGRNPLTDKVIIPSDVVVKAATGVTTPTAAGSLSDLSFTAVVSRFPHIEVMIISRLFLTDTICCRNTYLLSCSNQHGGSTPGFNTQIIRFPFDNVGIAVLTNDDSFGGLFMEVIKGRIIDEIFGLEPLDWNSRVKQLATAAYNQALNSLVLRPADASPPSVPFASLAGEYRNPAYGSLYFCSILVASGSIVENSDPSCKEFIHELPVRLPESFNTSVPTLFAQMKSTWLSHIRLEHFDNNLFNVTGFASLPILEPSESELSGEKQKYWAKIATENSPITVEFAFSDQGDVVGLGAAGGLWGAGPGVEGPTGDTVQDRAEVWFDRLGS
ncbi:hypothetical protein D9757_003079 [Collybiopsis confluens]|uniref:Beta-lactamase-related domain-containing protein n=1 Tax=Collybiopsis confluens TaxID=2823264 RepID=A0A8H5MEM4_9AGAR|nr:hypothetical protein D9757_003079 [Collybiopsis confluens]